MSRLLLVDLVDVVLIDDANIFVAVVVVIFVNNFVPVVVVDSAVTVFVALWLLSMLKLFLLTQSIIVVTDVGVDVVRSIFVTVDVVVTDINLDVVGYVEVDGIPDLKLMVYI